MARSVRLDWIGEAKMPDHHCHGAWELKDNPLRRGFKWKLLEGSGRTREFKRIMKAKRTRAERRQLARVEID